MEELLRKYLVDNETLMKATKVTMKSLEIQLGQLQKALSERAPDTLLSNTKDNLRERVHTAIAKFEGESEDALLATAKVNPEEKVAKNIFEEERKEEVEKEKKEDEKELLLAKPEDKEGKKCQAKEKARKKAELKKEDNSVRSIYPLPFPQSLRLDNETEREGKFKRVLGKLEASLPFVRTKTQTPSYKRFLKSI